MSGETDHLFDEDQHPRWCAKCEHWSEDCRCSEDEPVPNDSENAQEWEAISAQLDYWRDMDLEYWRRRREQAYQAYLDRQLNTKQ